MEKIKDSLKTMMTEERRSGNAPSITDINFYSKEWAQKECDAFNAAALPPTEDGFFCPLCKNKKVIGTITEYRGGWYQDSILCSCIKRYQSMAALRSSGLGEDIKKLDSYDAKAAWQQALKKKAADFIEHPERCFFIGGQTGAGKTHLCNGISWELIQKGKLLLYLCWADEVTKLTNYSNQDRFERLEQLANVDVLYIDDLLKPCGGKYPRSEIQLAFDIIDRRYRDKDKITIISSELTFDKLSEVDEATAGRVAEMARGYTLDIGADIKKNYRLRR